MAVIRQPENSVHIEDKRYEKIAEIATGGMATVYFGRVRGAGGFERRVAIKEMLPHLAKSTEFVRMFFDEARLASRIHHPNVVATLDMTESDGSHALILEYVEGPSLQQIMKYLAERGATMPLDIALRIFLDILAGLHAAHELEDENGRSLNLVHRDVSPQNMLVGTDGITKITDFGIARAESRLSTTRTGSVKGKVPYMSPEQVKSLPVDRRTDVYAAGVILWEMLTSQRLVQGETDVAMIYQVTDREAVSPLEWNPAIPEPIAKVCLKALEKRAENRFASATELMDAIEEAASASTIMPASPRAVGTYIRGLALHHSGAELEANFRRRSLLDLSAHAPESSSSTSMLSLVSVRKSEASRGPDGRRSKCSGGPRRVPLAWFFRYRISARARDKPTATRHERGGNSHASSSPSASCPYESLACPDKRSRRASTCGTYGINKRFGNVEDICGCFDSIEAQASRDDEKDKTRV